MNDDRRFWLAFSLVSGIGAKRIAQLLQKFGTLEAAWHATEAQLKQTGLDETRRNLLLQARSKLDLNAEVAKIRRVGAQFLTLVDEGYPRLLKELPDAPPVLYVLGDLSSADEQALAVVGTRKATRYGRDAAFDLSQKLAAQGVTIVSGLAPGIDAAAHQGALRAGGRTIAVFGCGIDNVYPREHYELARKITKHGALISEFSIGTPPDGRNFPRRNRVISGIALGVLVVEAPESSGALITAEMAGEQGRDVFAVPSNIYNQLGTGSNRLIQDGAKLVMDASDVLDELRITHEVIQTQVKTERIAPESPNEQVLLSHLSVDPIHIDDLVRLSGLSIATVSGTLTLLELKGLVEMVGHMQYSLQR